MAAVVRSDRIDPWASSPTTEICHGHGDPFRTEDLWEPVYRVTTYDDRFPYMSHTCSEVLDIVETRLVNLMEGSAHLCTLIPSIKRTTLSSVVDTACIFHIRMESTSEENKLAKYLEDSFVYRDRDFQWMFQRLDSSTKIVCKCVLDVQQHMPLKLLNCLLHLYCKHPCQIMKEVLDVKEHRIGYILTYVPLVGHESGDLPLQNKQLSIPLRRMWQRITSRMDQRKLGFACPDPTTAAAYPEKTSLVFHNMQVTATHEHHSSQVYPHGNHNSCGVHAPPVPLVPLTERGMLCRSVSMAHGSSPRSSGLGVHRTGRKRFNTARYGSNSSSSSSLKRSQAYGSSRDQFWHSVQHHDQWDDGGRYHVPQHCNSRLLNSRRHGMNHAMYMQRLQTLIDDGCDDGVDDGPGGAFGVASRCVPTTDSGENTPARWGGMPAVDPWDTSDVDLKSVSESDIHRA